MIRLVTSSQSHIADIGHDLQFQGTWGEILAMLKPEGPRLAFSSHSQVLQALQLSCERWHGCRIPQVSWLSFLHSINVHVERVYFFLWREKKNGVEVKALLKDCLKTSGRKGCLSQRRWCIRTTDPLCRVRRKILGRSSYLNTELITLVGV